MSDLENFEKYCQENNYEQVEKYATQISKAINKREVEMVQIIGYLKPLLTNTNIESVSCGMKIISNILYTLNCDILNHEEIQILLEFFNNRLKDNVLVIEKTVPGLQSLCHFTHFNFEMASTLFFMIQNELAIQILRPDYKVIIYKTIGYIIYRYKSDFFAIGSNFVYGFLRIVDAETSPTSLVLVFEMFYEVVSHNKFDVYAEDLFEAMACYFPIIYSKTKNDKHIETKMHLSKLLNRAMSAAPCMAEYVIQLVLEKLESESIGSKQSSYELLESALPRYSVEQVEPFIFELWTFIRIDSLKPTKEEDELTSYALRILSKLGEILFKDPTLSTSFLQKIWKDLEISLKTPELSLIKSTINIFISLASNNHEIFKYFFERSNPILLQSLVFNNHDEHQMDCLNALNELVIAGSKINFVFDTETIERFFGLLIDHFSNQSSLQLCKLNMIFLNQLLCVHRFEDIHIEKLVNHINEYSQQTDYRPEFMEPSFELISNISIYNSEQISKIFVEPLKYEIKNSIKDNNFQNRNRIIFQLTALRSASHDLNIFTNLSGFIASMLVNLMQESKEEFRLICLLNLFETLSSCFEIHRKNSEFIYSFRENCIRPMMNQLIILCFKDQIQSISFEGIQKFAFLNYQFVSTLDSDEKQSIINQISQSFLEENVSGLIQDMENVNIVWNEPSSIKMYLYMNIIYSYFYDSNGIISFPLVFNQIKSHCFETKLSWESYNSVLDISGCLLSRIVTQLFNQINSTDFTQFCQNLFFDMKNKINSDISTDEERIIAIHILMWISKSLMLVNDQLFEEFTKYILQTLDQNILTTYILNLIDILYSDLDFFQRPPSSSSTKETSKKTKQFSNILHKLIFERFQLNHKPEFLYLFASHLRFISEKDFSTQVEELFPVILTGLKSFEFDQVQHICLSFVETMLQNHYTQIQPHIESILKTLITLARNSFKLYTRKKALDCICLIIDISPEKDLVNVKTDSLRSLQPTLGDQKRLVRASAVKAYCKLSMLAQPGNRSKLAKF